MTLTQTIWQNHIALLAEKQGARSAGVGVLEKSTRELKPKVRLLRFKSTIHIYIAIFNVRALNRIGQLPELTASAAEHDIDIIGIRVHRYYHCEVEIKYHDT